MQPSALIDRVSEGKGVRLRLVERNKHGSDPEDLKNPVTNCLDDAFEVELLGKCLADLVDDSELGVALLCLSKQVLRFVEKARVLQGDAETGGDRRQKTFV